MLQKICNYSFCLQFYILTVEELISNINILILSAGSKCITIHYNMYGRSVGQLSMKLITESGDISDVFQEKGSKGIEWKSYFFFLEVPLPFKVSKLLMYI